MPRIFITGSTDGLGRAAAGVLISEGHDVVLHARTRERAAALSDLAPDAAGVVIGDLASAAETRELAGQVNQIGRMDAVIHNAGLYLEPSRATTVDGHAKTLAVNTLAPYMLTALIDRPDRLIYLSSGLHRAGAGSLRDIDWTSRSWNAAQAYAESKLHVIALALTLARAWPEVLCNAVDPGWVPTTMGGPAATDDLRMGYLTQTWLAVSNDAAATVSGGYWYHRQRQAPAAQARDPAFQDQLMDRLAALTGVVLPLASRLHVDTPEPAMMTGRHRRPPHQWRLLHHDVPDPPAQHGRLLICDLGHRPVVGRPPDADRAQRRIVCLLADCRRPLGRPRFCLLSRFLEDSSRMRWNGA